MVDINDQCFGGVAPGVGWGEGINPTLSTALQWNATSGALGSDPLDRSLSDVATRLAQSGSGLTKTAGGVTSNVDGFSAQRHAGVRANFRGGRERAEGDPPVAKESSVAEKVIFFVIVLILGLVGYLGTSFLLQTVEGNPHRELGQLYGSG
jgi:hypothetical protein